MAWNGEVPLLGFDAEYYSQDWDKNGGYKRILYIPVKRYGEISIYAWTLRQEEGYNIFWPRVSPLHPPTAQANDPFTVKMIVQAYLNRLDHFNKTGEIDDAYELQSSGNGRQA